MPSNPFDRITIFQGDVTTLAVDAIVNAANTSLLGGGGVDGAIHRAAGPDLLAECRTLNRCPAGEARLTRGYNLPARYVIHTVGPIYSGSPSDQHLLRSCYEKSLQIAIDDQLATIAFPAISCGAYGYPMEEAATIAIDTTTRYIEKTDQLKMVTFVLFSRHDFDIYSKMIKTRLKFVFPVDKTGWRE
ncbi:O-acetyl-ADP-ribose deacetylase [Thermodesulfobacteriota bacterium]